MTLEDWNRLAKAIDDVAKVNPDLGELFRYLLDTVERLSGTVERLDRGS